MKTREQDVPLDDRLPTTAQNEWVNVADLLRGHIDKLAKQHLKPEELKWLIDSATSARNFDLLARCFDNDIDKRESRYGCDH